MLRSLLNSFILVRHVVATQCVIDNLKHVHVYYLSTNRTSLGEWNELERVSVHDNQGKSYFEATVSLSSKGNVLLADGQ